MDGIYTKASNHDPRRRKIKVVHLLSGKEGGGILTVVLSLINNFDPDVIEPSIIFLSPNSVPGEKSKQRYKCHFIKKRFRGNPLVILKIISFCIKHHIDILHTHSISSNFYGRLAGILTPGTRVITTVHAWTHDELRGVYGDSRISVWLHRIDLWMSRLSKRLITVSGALKEDLISRRISKGKIHVISHGIKVNDLHVEEQEIQAKRQALKLLPEEKIIGIVGRLTPVKNHELFLRAAKWVSDRNSNCRFLIIGDGPLRQKLEGLALRLSIEDLVIFTGWVDQIAPFMNLMDLMVMTSHSEGFGYVLLEGMACGKPVVATSVSEIPRIIIHGKTGLLIPPGDHQALAKSIEILIRNHKLRKEIGQRARQSVAERFKLDHEVKDTISVYLQVLGLHDLFKHREIPLRHL
jgi:glycosyltransferase involved in cell wall biosynthesis